MASRRRPHNIILCSDNSSLGGTVLANPGSGLVPHALSAPIQALGKAGRYVGKKIVLVDDDRLVLQSVSALLSSSGYLVWATESTEEAVDLTRTIEPDVLVTDYRMPLMDGVSLLERVKELAVVPLMLVYSATPPPGERLAQRLPGVYWVAKTAGHGALLGRLTDLLERSVGPS
jgi:CheY-like chemotaxis protein